MPYALLIIGLQIYCGIHCMRYRRNFSWLFLIIFAPLIGSIIYIAVEVWPSTRRRHSQSQLDYHPRYGPSPKAQQLERQTYRAAYRVEAQEQTAQQLMEKGAYEEAAEHYRCCLHGPLENEPHLLYQLAEASFAAQDFSNAIEALNKLRATSDHKPEAVRCLLARAYAATNQTEKAHKLFERLMAGTPNLDIRYYYAVYLEAFANPEQAHQAFRIFLNLAQLAPPDSELQTRMDHARKAIKMTH